MLFSLVELQIFSLCMISANILCIPQRNVIPVLVLGRAPLLSLVEILKHREGLAQSSQDCVGL